MVDKHQTAEENYVINEVFETLDATPKVVNCPVTKYLLTISATTTFFS